MKYSIVVLFCVFLITSCAKKEATGNLHITGNIQGLKKGTLYIQKIVDTSLVAIDTIKIDGSSTFKSDLHLQSPEMLYLFLDRGVTNSLDNNLPFFAEPGNMTIDTRLDLFLSGAKITGSKNNVAYEEFRKMRSRFTDQNLELMELKLHAFRGNHKNTIDSIEKLQDNNLRRRYLYTTNFAIEHKNLEIAPFLALSEIPDINIKYLDTIKKVMNPKVANSLYGKKLIALCKDRKSENK